MKVRVVLPNEQHTGNILWPDKYPMRGGKFPANHPVGGGNAPDFQYGNADNINSFRDRGYWASCFPEGDGITFRILNDQTDEQCLVDIRECFGWGF